MEKQMDAKDFSIRTEVVLKLEDMGLLMTREQVNDIVEEIEQYDTFLGVIGLFVAKGIKEIAEKEGIPFNEDEMEHQFRVNRESINFDDL